MINHCSHRSHNRLFASLLGLFLLFATGVTYGSCKSAAKVSAEVWKNWGGIASVVGCAVGTSAAGAPQATPLCIESATNYRNMVNKTVKGWNNISGESWAKIGPRILFMNSTNKGTLQSLGTRMYITPGPSNRDNVTIRIKEIGGESKTRVFICSTGMEGDIRKHKEIAFNKNKSQKKKVGDLYKVNIQGVRNRVVSVFLVSKGTTKKFSYTVQMKARAMTGNAKLKKRNPPLWVVSLGDSYSSGEGSPNNKKLVSITSEEAIGALLEEKISEGSIEINRLSLVERTAWASYNNVKDKLKRIRSRVRWIDKRCHRSKNGWPALVVASLKESFPNQDFEFDYLACSGASIEKGILGSYEGAEPGGKIDAQMNVLKRLIKDKRQLPDVVLMTAGGNDMRFAKIVTDCLTFGCATPKTRDEINVLQLKSDIIKLRGLYTKIAFNFKNMEVKNKRTGIPARNVFVLQYPDVFRDAYGNIQAGCWLVTNDKSFRWAYNNVYRPMNDEIKKAAFRYNWNLTTAVGSKSDMASFRRKGYCVGKNIKESFRPAYNKGWVRRLIPSLEMQLDVNGAFHPNKLGNDAMARAVQAKVDRHIKLLLQNQ